MSKILVVGDVHWSTYSSILRSRGEKYSTRLENLIDSVNWAENIASTQNCDMIVYLGDFFDSSTLVAEELTALNEIKWGEMYHYILCGNHEMVRSDLSLSSAHLFGLIPNCYIINQPMTMKLNDFTEVAFLPYILEENRKTISEYFGHKYCKRIVFSHNDIKDFQMGGFISKIGFTVDDIESSCDLFLNGHLHNGGQISKKAINVGNLTGQNFSEDALKYKHLVYILDTQTLALEYLENSFAFNFYKLQENIPDLKSNAVISLKCSEENASTLKEQLLVDKRVVASRLVILPTIRAEEEITREKEKLTVDHLQKFYDFVIETQGSNDVVLAELAEVCK